MDKLWIREEWLFVCRPYHHWSLSRFGQKWQQACCPETGRMHEMPNGKWRRRSVRFRSRGWRAARCGAPNSSLLPKMALGSGNLKANLCRRRRLLLNNGSFSLLFIVIPQPFIFWPLVQKLASCVYWGPSTDMDNEASLCFIEPSCSRRLFSCDEYWYSITSSIL